MKLQRSKIAGSKMSSVHLRSEKPLLKIKVTLSAPFLIADLAQSIAVSPIPILK